MSQRYARSSKPNRSKRQKLSRIQLLSIIFTVLIVCLLVGGITGSIIVSAWNDRSNDSSDSTDTASTDDLLPELQQTAEANPNEADAQAQLANYLANTGEFDQAVPYYEKALALTPDDWDLRLDFAQVLMDNGKLSDAELQFDTILKAQPDNAEAWYYEGQLYQQSSPPRTDEAIYNYQQTIRSDPTSYVAQQAEIQLQALGAPASPVSIPAASPEAG